MNLLDKLDKVEYLLKHMPGKHNQKLHDPHRGRGAVYYRGTNPGDTRRISTGLEEWDKNLFVTETQRGAHLYGSSIEEIVLSPDAKILREGTSEWRKAPKWKSGTNMLEWSNNVKNWAESQGYDAVHFARQTDIGTVILNPGVIESRRVLEHTE